MADNKKKIILVYGGFLLIIFIITLFLALFDSINWITFFIFTLILIIIVVLSLFLYYIFIGRKKDNEEKDEEQKKILTEEECEKIASELIEEHYTDFIKEVKDRGIKHFGEDNTPVFLYHVEGEWGMYNKKFYIILINMFNGSKRIINYDIKNLSSDEIVNLILKAGEGLSSKPKKEIVYRVVKDMGPIPGMERVTREPVKSEKKEEKKEEKEEGGLT